MNINSKEYSYPHYNVKSDQIKFNLLCLNCAGSGTPQYELFNTMLNIGIIQFNEGIFSLTDKDIAYFWLKYKDSILKHSYDDYCSILGLPAPYRDLIPYLKGKNRFKDTDYKINVFWTKPHSSSMYQAFSLNGLELFNRNGECVGTILPEYYDLFLTIDNINNKWVTCSKQQKYDLIGTIFDRQQSLEFEIDDDIKRSYNRR